MVIGSDQVIEVALAVFGTFGIVIDDDADGADGESPT